MLIFESLRMALSAIMTHKLRSFLTLLGVIIGVMTIIGMMTVMRVLPLTAGTSGPMSCRPLKIPCATPLSAAGPIILPVP